MIAEGKEIDLERLGEHFDPEDIEWRIQRSGIKKTNNADEVWCVVVPYVTNRAIMDRLDNVCGMANWQNTIEHAPDGSFFISGISIYYNGQWITKHDGSDATAIERTKGGISGAMKRAGVQWKIGRYLYKMEDAWAEVCYDKPPANVKSLWNYATVEDKKSNTKKTFYWKAPNLSIWALPNYTKKFIDKIDTCLKKAHGSEEEKISAIKYMMDIQKRYNNLFNMERIAPDTYNRAMELFNETLRDMKENKQ